MRTGSLRSAAVGVMLWVVIGFGTSGGSGAAPAKQPAGAGGPMRKFELAVAAADGERERAIDRARAELVTELKAAQKAALQNNDVDGATTLAALAKENAATPAVGRQAFVGAKFAAYDWQVTLLADGTIKHSHPEFGGRWTYMGERTVAVRFNHGYVDLWTVDPTGKKFTAVAHKAANEYAGTVDK